MPSQYIYNTPPTPKVQETMEGGLERLEEPNSQEVCCKIVPSIYARKLCPINRNNTTIQFDLKNDNIGGRNLMGSHS